MMFTEEVEYDGYLQVGWVGGIVRLPAEGVVRLRRPGPALVTRAGSVH